MFLNKKELIDLYQKIKNGTATSKEKETFDFELESSSLSKEYIIDQLEKDLNR